MIDLLVWILILCLVFGVIYYVITLIPLPHPFRPIALAIIGLIFLLVLIRLLLGIPAGAHFFRY